MDKLTEGIIIGGIVGATIANAQKATPTEQVQQEIERRYLSAMSPTELQVELAKRKEKQEDSDSATFWFCMFIGCFIFPWICIPICLIKLMIGDSAEKKARKEKNAVEFKEIMNKHGAKSIKIKNNW